MTKRMKLEIVESTLSATAVLLEEEAPNTCKIMWEVLEDVVENTMLHGIWTGRTIEVNLPKAMRNFEPSVIPMENASVHPIPGDILWSYLPKGMVRGINEDQWNIVLAYGPEAIMRNPAGFQPGNIWARVVGDAEAFYEECAKMWFGKAQTLRISRAT